MLKINFFNIYSTPCSSVSIFNFEQVYARWEANPFMDKLRTFCKQRQTNVQFWRKNELLHLQFQLLQLIMHSIFDILRNVLLTGT